MIYPTLIKNKLIKCWYFKDILIILQVKIKKNLVIQY